MNRIPTSLLLSLVAEKVMVSTCIYTPDRREPQTSRESSREENYRGGLRTGRSEELSFMKGGDVQRSREVQRRRSSNWGIIYEVHRFVPQGCPLF